MSRGNILTATIDHRQRGMWITKLKRDRTHELVCAALFVFNTVMYAVLFAYVYHAPTRYLLIPVGGVNGWMLARSIRTVRVCSRDLGALGPARARLLTKTTARR